MVLPYVNIGCARCEEKIRLSYFRSDENISYYSGTCQKCGYEIRANFERRKLKKIPEPKKKPRRMIQTDPR
jgi:RNase P subunit RPR2